jgi:hypothetical protein
MTDFGVAITCILLVLGFVLLLASRFMTEQQAQWAVIRDMERQVKATANRCAQLQDQLNAIAADRRNQGRRAYDDKQGKAP